MIPAIAFPAIDPVLIEIGPIVIRWYALAYLAGLMLGWRMMIRMAKAPGAPVTVADADDFLVWATVGVILGGRVGYVLFYKPAHFLADPVSIFAVWQGGMSFHGGILGVIVAALWFCRRRSIPALAFGDMLARVAPIGLFFGRIANFINAELYGRVSDVPWAVVFPTGGPEPRHPSQLYEAALEGLVLFIILNLMARSEALRVRHGLFVGVFLAGYGIARGLVEFVREPDAHIGMLGGVITMGQMLSLPMIAAGLVFIAYAMRRNGNASS